MNTFTSEQKKELRKRMKEIRKVCFNDIANQDLADNFISSSFIQKESFFIYCPIQNEADTKKIIHYLFKKEKKIYLPRIENKQMVMVPIDENTTFKKNSYGIYEPIGQAYFGKVDVTIVPLLAVDKQGHRLGYGGGYYDYFLKNNKTISIGYCFEEQVIATVPQEEMDKRLDWIITNQGIYKMEENKK